MALIWLYSLAAVVVVSLTSLIGVFTLAFQRDSLNRLLLFMVSFAVGGLFGDAFIHLIPEAFTELGNKCLVSLLIIVGILLFFVLEKFIRWRHCHIPTSEQHPHPVVFMNLIGDGAHNFIDGLVIGASFIVSLPIGIATTLAVILHEIPHEIGNFGILLHGGLTIKRALLFNFLSALLAILGTLFSLVLGPLVKDYALFVLPVTAGGFIYLAGSDLIPELHDETDYKKSFGQFLAIILGIALMTLLLFVGK